MNIKGVNFPNPLLDALRDGRLVLFSGAGISMGAPANLPDFPALARQIAEGTGQFASEGESEDRFLGRLKGAGTDVHRRAAELLRSNGPEPTELHRNLLNLSKTPRNVRIVTTNFDLLFEQAAESLFDPVPKMFLSPALPYGRRFQGIAHIHGSVSEPDEMVLTSQDFGRAYLTEADGWARRFLVDMFASHTVLFVGYSHYDTIMTYLTPSMPRDGTAQRYALVGDLREEQEHWRNMGVEPITFPQANKNDYTGLDQAVEGLANYIQQRILDWQQQITRIASGPPPLEEETAGVIEHALNDPDPVYTRFFVEAAESPRWLAWLDSRNYLDALFSYGELTGQEELLASRLGRFFAVSEPDALFSLIERHGSRLNRHLWNTIAWRMGQASDSLPNQQILSRWVHLLTSTIPPDFNDALLEKMAENCAGQGLLVNTLQIHDMMTASRRQGTPGFDRNESDLSNYQIQTLWEKCLKPNLPEIAEALLEKTVWRLKERHSLIRAWKGENALDYAVFRRSAIESHQQDRHPGGIDALINIARDCLEWLAANRPDAVRLWAERHSRSPAPLLRRLAVHILPDRTDLSADGKIAWLLKRYDVNELPAKHEIFRAVARMYPGASLKSKKSLIELLLNFRWPREDDPDRDRWAAYHKLDWLQWLNNAAPDCPLTKAALDNLKSEYPEFQPSEHPDMTSRSETWTGVLSPWTVEELLGRPAREWSAALLEYQPSQPFDHVNRSGLLTAVTEAAQENFAWGLELAREMADMGNKDADLWPCLLRAWSTAELGQDDIRQVLAHLSDDRLYQPHARELVNALYEVVKNVTGPETLDLLAQANSIARNLHNHAIKVDPPQMTRYIGGAEEEVDWHTKAINHPSGRLAQFWLHSISLWRRQQELPPVALSDEYQDVLSETMATQDLPGKLARVIFASGISLLISADEEWTKRNLIPILAHDHDEFESAWNGVTYSSSFTPSAAELLREPFLQAVEHIHDKMTPETKARFVAIYISMLTWFVSGPTDQWVTKLLMGAGQDVRQQFADEIGHHMRFLDEPTQNQWWSNWLRGYWENRLIGIPAPLNAEETEAMIEWTTSLPAVYPKAVELAIRMPVPPMRPGMLIHRLADSDIPAKYPESVARLLIRLSEADDPHYTWHGARPIIEKLLQSPLDEDTKTGLQEILVKFNL